MQRHLYVADSHGDATPPCGLGFLDTNGLIWISFGGVESSEKQKEKKYPGFALRVNYY